MAGTSVTNWTAEVSELLRRDGIQMALETPTSIFKLPDSVTKENPQAYSPSRLFLGPNHELSLELYKMEIFKLKQAKVTKERFQLPEFTQMVDELKELEVQIRASYDRNLAIGSEALAWRILIDGLFLLWLLGIYVEEKSDEGSSIGKRNHSTNEDNSSLAGSLNQRSEIELPVFSERELYLKFEGNITTMTQNEMVIDLLKLENQIPFQVLKRVLPKEVAENLTILFYKFCVSVSPLPLSLPSFNILTTFDDKLSQILDQSQHLLHFLYVLVYYQRLFAYDLVPVVPASIPRFELLKLLVEVVQVDVLQQLVEAMDFIKILIGMLGKIHQSSPFATETSPGLPSASKLKKVGIKFHGGHYGGFDDESRTLTLPIITVNDFCEVILRNLVAFELEAKFNPGCFSHYMKLMSRLIATAKDVRILKRAGIIAGGRSGDEDDVVKLFKDLGNALIKVSSDSKDGESNKSTANLGWSIKFEIHITEKIIKYYESRWRVKAERFMKRYIFPVLRALLILVVVVLILIVAIRTVCGWFSCPKIMGHKMI